jgi:hypothetical protein
MAGNVLVVKMAIMQGAFRAQGQLLPHDPWFGYGIIDGPGILAKL